MTLFLSFCIQSKGQEPSQGNYGNIDDVIIANEHLVGQKIKLSNGTTTSVKYNVDMSRSSVDGGNSNWYPVDMKVGLGYKEGNAYKFFNGAYLFKNGDFGMYSSTLYKLLTADVDHSKLPTGAKIYILYETHKPNVPESGWRIEAYSLSGSVVAYDFISGTTTPGPDPEPGAGEPVIGVPPAFTAPEVGSVPLYEYVSGLKRRFTTVYYSSFPGYTYNGILGYVFTSATPETVPLYKYGHPTNGNVYYSISQSGPPAYIYIGIVCYVYASQITNAFPVYVNYSASLGGYHRYSKYPDIFPNYRFDGITFYILQNSDVSHLVAVNSFAAKSGGHHYLSTNVVDDWNYWNYLGASFRVPNTQLLGTLPVNVFFSSKGKDHLYTMGGISDYSWWASEGVAFYAYPSQFPGTIPIYSHTSKDEKDHYYSPDGGILDANYWKPVDGVAFYAYPVN
ncbi:hypothetical protein [Pedobacter sp. ok626]|uniref:hypothetical protein n=1 Tax=Pedobacter sp. ok626 TaxID=1761882 RepID=UPI00104D8104|nr:hypothetical protein [Pedobacter sp. ok626]